MLLVSIDSLRADHLGFMGYRADTSPALDRLAADGVVFSQVFSTSSWTLPAHAALFTGMHDSSHGVLAARDRLSESVPTLAEAFSRAGYRTVGFYAGPFLHPLFGLGRGFDEYIDCTSYELGSKSRAPESFFGASHRDVTGPIVRKKVISWLDGLGADRFFMFVHLWDVHYDYIPPPPYDSMFDADYQGTIDGRNFRLNKRFSREMPAADFDHILALYDGEIRFADETLGVILGALEARGLMDDTIVLVTADHGDEFLDHDGRGHRQTIYQEVARVPMVLYYPRVLEPRRVDYTVSLIDAAPTLLDLAGVEPMPTVQGRSLRTIAQKGYQEGAEDWAALTELRIVGKSISSIVVGKKRLILYHGGAKRLYFDLENDPTEQNPLPARVADADGKLHKELLALLARARKETATAVRLRDSQIGGRVKEQLDSLGYLN